MSGNVFDSHRPEILQCSQSHSCPNYSRKVIVLQPVAASCCDIGDVIDELGSIVLRTKTLFVMVCVAILRL